MHNHLYDLLVVESAPLLPRFGSVVYLPGLLVVASKPLLPRFGSVVCLAGLLVFESASLLPRFESPCQEKKHLKQVLYIFHT